MSLELRHLKLVTAIAEEGGLSRAAGRLHLTQSALSHQLHDAEEHLGAPLFHRLSRSMTLTPAGERLLRSAHAVLDELARAEREISGNGSASNAVLRMSTECYTNYHWLPSRLKVFHRKFPRVDVQVVVEATNHPLRALLEGKLDLAIVSTRVRNHRIMFAPLFSAEMVAVMPPDHLLARRPFVRAEDVARETLIAYSSYEDNLTLQELLRPAGLAPPRVLRVQLTEAILEMVKEGLGISILARWAVAPQVAAGNLRAVRLTPHGFRRDWCAATLRRKSLPTYLHEFVALLAKEPRLNL